MRLRRRCGSFTTTSTPDGSANRLANTAKRIAATPASSPPASPRRSTSRTRAKQVVREAPSFNMYAYAEGCSTSSRNKHSANNSAFLPAARAASASASSFSHLPPSLPAAAAAAAALCLVSRLRFMSFVGHSTITACRNAKDLPGTAARFTSASPSRSNVSVSLVERSEDDEAALARVGDAGAVGELEGGEEGDDDGVEEGVEGKEAIALSCLTRAGTAAALALRRGWRASSPALASVAATAAALSVSIAAATAAARAEAAAALLSERPIGA
mmetsp:Transcript_67656/g.136227  ORF Transcript_67656/g.136227 Transcript_67656/m.136227 type:complete len:272 (+) Transcript_67656:803-1618(+)